MTHVPPEGSPRRSAAWCSLEGRGTPVLELAWLALVAVAVAGRLWQPEWQGARLWNVTPLTAVALAAGALFPNRLLAAAAPLAALAISNFFEPAYGNWGIAAVVYAASAWPVLCGGLVNRHRWAAVGEADAGGKSELHDLTAGDAAPCRLLHRGLEARVGILHASNSPCQA